MPRVALPLVAGETYHLHNRGANRQRVFYDRENYLFFLRRLRRYLVGEGQTSEVSKTSEVYASIVAYCLMPTHYHLLVCPHDDHLSRRMQRLMISYTKAMNKRCNRVGALFQGQFQAVWVDRDIYLLHLSRYIHLNPVASGLVNQPEYWEFSSYRDSVGLRQGTLPTPEVVLSQFTDRSEYEVFVRQYSLGEQEFFSHLLLDDG